MSYPSKPIENDRLREKLIKILREPIFSHELADPTEVVADYLLDNDVVPVVRCKDCNHCFHDPKLLAGLVDGVYVCGIWGRGLPHMKPDDFCSYGEESETQCI